MAFGDLTVVRSTPKRVLNSSGVIAEVAINTPAFEFNLDGTYKGNLLELASTNVALYSQQIDNASWGKAGGGTGSVPVVTANDAIAPDGTMTADKVDFALNGGNTLSDQSKINQVQTIASPNTTSVWMKTADASTKILRLNRSGVDNNITVTPVWQRFSFTGTVSTNNDIRIGLRGNLGTSDSASVHIWGVQLELGSVATSYIPTEGSTVTRGADTVSRTSATSLIGQVSGTIYLEYESRDTSSVSTPFVIASDNDNRIAFIRNADKTLSAVITQGGNEQANITTTGTPSGVQKIAIAYANNDVAFYNAGVSVGTDTSATIPSMSSITLGANDFNGWIRKAVLFGVRLSNAQLQALTT
jgi:hypothetical protein